MKLNFLIIVLFFEIFLIYGNYSFVMPFFPLISEKKGLNTNQIGNILALYSIGGFLSSISLTYLISKFSKKLLLLFYNGLLIIVTISYGLLEIVDNKPFYIIFSIFVRFFNGVCIASLASLSLSFIPVIYKEEEKKIAVISYFQISIGLGVIFGFFFGGFLYDSIGFQKICYFYGLFLFIFEFLIFFSLNSYLEKENFNSINNEKNIEKTKSFISWKLVLKNPKFVLIYLQFSCVCCAFIIYTPGLYKLLKNKYNLATNSIGIFYSLTEFIFIAFSFIYPNINWKSSRISHILFSNFMLSFSLMLIGPITIFHNSLILTTLGLSFMGLFFVFGIIPFIPVMIKIMGSFTDKYSNENRSEIASSCFSNAWCLGEFVGYIFYGYFTGFFGFENGIALFSIPMLTIFILYFVFIKEKSEKKKEGKNYIKQIELNLMN